MKYLDHVSYPIDDNPAWELYEHNFNKFYPSKGEQRIPKKLHQVWLGSPFPDSYRRLSDTWIEKHPDWEYKCWDDVDAEDFDMINRKAFDKIDNLGAKSDIFRYEILNKYGGLYIDTDFECIKPFDDLISLDFIIGNGWEKTPLIFNGLMGCAPGNAFIKSVIEGIHEKEVRAYYRLDKIMDFAGTYFITELFIDYLKKTKDKAVAFPQDFFYPLPNSIREDVREDCPHSREVVKSYIKDVSYAVHLWYVSWITPVKSTYELAPKKVRCECGNTLLIPINVVFTCSGCNSLYKVAPISKKNKLVLQYSKYDRGISAHRGWACIKTFE